MPGTFQHSKPMDASTSLEKETRGQIAPLKASDSEGSAAQLLQVVGRVGRIGQRGDNVDENEPPFVVVEEAANLPLFE